MENNLTGFEFLSCIPGTVGGGIKMNAGCFGHEFKIFYYLYRPLIEMVK